MNPNRLTENFAQASTGKRAALIPYFTAGFPTLDVTEALIRGADEAGATVVELGIPYSDSIADGPVIQSSYHDVLARGQRLDDVFELVSRVRDSVSCGLVAMVSFSIVHRSGVDRFMATAAAVGFDGVILPDVPVEESAHVADAVGRAGLCLIGLIAPTTSDERRKRIVGSSSGFVYQIAVAGTTGERLSVSDTVRSQVQSLRKLTKLPVCVGFGISSAEQVEAVCRFADGAIIGSALVRRLAGGLRENLSADALVDGVMTFVRQLAGAAHRDTA